VKLGKMEAIPNEDLVLDVSWKTLNDPIVWRDGNELAAMVPSAKFGQASDGSRCVAFLLDRSGSMGSTPMRQARLAIKACIGALGDNDEFGIIAFDDQVVELPLAFATKNAKESAARFLDRIESRGSTEFHLAISAGAAMLRGKPNSDMVMVTDDRSMAMLS